MNFARVQRLLVMQLEALRARAIPNMIDDTVLRTDLLGTSRVIIIFCDHFGAPLLPKRKETFKRPISTETRSVE